MTAADQPPPDPTIPRQRITRNLPPADDIVAPTVPASQRVSGIPGVPGRSGTNRVAPARQPDPRPERFALGEELGRGGMGTVRLAEDPALRRELAVKFLQAPGADAAERFVEEAQITAQLQHPNIVPVYELGQDAAGRPWLAMKRIEGESLADRIAEWRSHGPRSRLRPDELSQILGIFDKVCDAVAFAHSRGVIHRDIKPHNIMVGAYGEVLLVDWGLARPLAHDGRRTTGSRLAKPVRSARRESDRNRTVDGDIFGTPAYMPPEQAEGRADEVDQRSDIFSLAGVLYHMLTLEPPYAGETGFDAMIRAARHQLIPPRQRTPQRGIPEELQAIVLKAMAGQPADRYASVADLQADLAAWQAYRPTTAWRPGPIARVVKWSRRNPRTTLTAALVLLFGSVTAAVVATSMQQLAVAQRDVAESASRAATEREARLRELASRQEWEALAREIGAKIARQRDAAVVEFDTLYAACQQRGVYDADFIRTLSEADRQRFRTALDNLLATHQRDPSLVHVVARDWLLRALLRNFAGDREGALADYAAAIAFDPEYPDARSNRGTILRELGRLDEAEADFNAALAINPQMVEAYVNRGIARHDLGRDADALADYDRALAINRRFVKAWMNRGALHRASGRLQDAFDDFSEAVRLSPDYVQARINRGSVLLGLGRMDEAVADYDAAIAVDPAASAEAYYGRAMVNQMRGRADAAFRDFASALVANPDYAEAHSNRGLLHRAQGNLDAAIADFRAALTINPRLVPALCNLGDTLRMQGKLDDAAAPLNEAVRLAPDDARTYATRGILWQTQGRLDDALADYDATLRLDPTHWMTAANRGQILESRGRRADALASYQLARRNCPDAAIRGRLAGDIRRLGGTPGE